MTEDATLEDFADAGTDEGASEAESGARERPEADPVDESADGASVDDEGEAVGEAPDDGPGGEDSDGEAVGDGTDNAEAIRGGNAADEGPEPAVPTYQWSPTGLPCDACGESRERRWRADEQFVCESCKEW